VKRIIGTYTSFFILTIAIFVVASSHPVKP
jgi:hypothetical protein